MKNKYPNKLIDLVYWIDSRTDLLGKMERKRAEWLLKKFPLHKFVHKSDMLLDVGSGMGDIPTLLNKKTGIQIFGIDIIDYRRREIKSLNFYHFIKANAYEIPFRDNSFDKILIFVTLHHLVWPEKAIVEALRILKSKGFIIILEDIIGPPGSFLKFITIFIDNIINLTLEGNPNTNKMENEWHKLLEEFFGLEKVESYTIKWGPLFKSLKLGLFIYKKR